MLGLKGHYGYVFFFVFFLQIADFKFALLAYRISYPSFHWQTTHNYIHRPDSDPDFIRFIMQVHNVCEQVIYLLLYQIWRWLELFRIKSSVDFLKDWCFVFSPRGVQTFTLNFCTCSKVKVLLIFSSGLELPFMMMSHPLIPVSLPPASVTMAMNQMNHLSTIASMAATVQAQNDSSRVATSVIKVRTSSQDQTLFPWLLCT